MLIPFLSAHAQFNETMPTDYWVYDIIDQLKLRGFFRTLPQGAEPYTRAEIAKLILTERDSAKNEFEKSLFEKLSQEFKYEIESLSDTSHNFSFRPGVTLSEYYSNIGRNFRFRGRGYISFYYRDKVLIYNNSFTDQNLLDDTTYTGNRFRGFFAGYTEQSFVKLTSGGLSLKFGRDYAKWGYGRGGNLLISDYAIPYDMLQLEVNLRRLKYTWFVSQLEPRSDTSRYLIAHRLEFNIGDKFYLGVAQAVLYGSKSFDFSFSNPFAFYYEFQVNENKSANPFIYFDASFYPMKNLNFYGEFLIDDWQISRKIQGELEPNAYGFIFGFKIGDVGFIGSNIQAEYTQVRNRTYNAIRDYEKFLRFKRPIAHPLGNDFQSLEIWISQWFLDKFQVTLNYKFIEHGEGGIEKPFDKPWMDTTKYSPATGYHEKFPYGVVEASHTIRTKIFYFVNSKLNFNLEISFSQYKNYRNREGERKKEFLLRLWFFYNIFKLL